MKKFLDDFKQFAFGGNLIETAVGLVLALATAALVNSLVETVIMPLVSAIFGAPDFSELWQINVGEGTILLGVFVTSLISFLAVALGVYLLVVKPWNAYKARVARAEEPTPAAPAEDILLLREIRDSLQQRT